MKKTVFKKMILGFYLISCLSLVSLAQADEGKKWGKRDFGKWQEEMDKKINEIYRKLNLSDEQKKLLDANKDKHRAQKKASKEETMSYRKLLREEIMKPDMDTNKVNELHAKIKELDAKETDERLQAMLEVRKILTHEQFVQFFQLMKEERPHHKK